MTDDAEKKAREACGCEACSYGGACLTRVAIAQAIREAAAETWIEAVDLVAHYWGFNNQRHTHTWHDKQYALDQMRAKAAELMGKR